MSATGTLRARVEALATHAAALEADYSDNFSLEYDEFGETSAEAAEFRGQLAALKSQIEEFRQDLAAVLTETGAAVAAAQLVLDKAEAAKDEADEVDGDADMIDALGNELAWIENDLAVLDDRIAALRAEGKMAPRRNRMTTKSWTAADFMTALDELVTAVESIDVTDTDAVDKLTELDAVRLDLQHDVDVTFDSEAEESEATSAMGDVMMLIADRLKEARAAVDAADKSSSRMTTKSWTADEFMTAIEELSRAIESVDITSDGAVRKLEDLGDVYLTLANSTEVEYADDAQEAEARDALREVQSLWMFQIQAAAVAASKAEFADKSSSRMTAIEELSRAIESVDVTAAAEAA